MTHFFYGGPGGLIVGILIILGVVAFFVARRLGY